MLLDFLSENKNLVFGLWTRGMQIFLGKRCSDLYRNHNYDTYYYGVVTVSSATQELPLSIKAKYCGTICAPNWKQTYTDVLLASCIYQLDWVAQHFSMRSSASLPHAVLAGTTTANLQGN